MGRGGWGEAGVGGVFGREVRRGEGDGWVGRGGGWWGVRGRGGEG